MGKEKDKKPLFGGIFQKFFKPSAKAEAKKKKENHLTVQRSIPYLEMGRDGICRVEEHLYSKTVRFYDINYQLAQNEDKNTIFESWCDFLNYFDASIRFQLSFINHKSAMSEYKKVIQIDPQKIGDVVGQRGKTINEIIDRTGVKIDITDDGAVSVCGTDAEMMNKAIEMIKIITTDFAEGQIFTGTVVSIKEFGAFVEFAPGKEGMVHISKIAKERIEHVEDVLTLGDKVRCKCMGKDKMGRLSFSIKDAE